MKANLLVNLYELSTNFAELPRNYCELVVNELSGLAAGEVQILTNILGCSAPES